MKIVQESASSWEIFKICLLSLDHLPVHYLKCEAFVAICYTLFCPVIYQLRYHLPSCLRKFAWEHPWNNYFLKINLTCLDTFVIVQLFWSPALALTSLSHSLMDGLTVLSNAIWVSFDSIWQSQVSTYWLIWPMYWMGLKGDVSNGNVQSALTSREY